MPFWMVDAFAPSVFAGNPAGVVRLEKLGQLSEQTMQQIAAEVNVSETTFVEPIAGEQNCYSIRWFTPAVEVALCGHATLAAAKVLLDSGDLAEGSEVTFSTLRSGDLLVKALPGGELEMDFPADPPEEKEVPGLREALGLSSEQVSYQGVGSTDALVEVGSPQAVESLRPDLTALAKLPLRGVIVTAAGGPKRAPDAHFTSRFFGPAVGVPEDPVTGSAHCCLAVHWSRRLGRDEMLGFQASSRGGLVGVAVAGDRIKLRGVAQTVIEGTMRVE